MSIAPEGGLLGASGTSERTSRPSLLMTEPPAEPAPTYGATRTRRRSKRPSTTRGFGCRSNDAELYLHFIKGETVELRKLRPDPIHVGSR